VEYAGYSFRSARSQRSTLHDNSMIRMPYYSRNEDGSRQLKSDYGSIEDIGTHQMYPGGPTKCFLIVQWFEDRGFSPVSGNRLVSTESTEKGFVFIEDIYQSPVAVWPHDPAGRLKHRDPRFGLSEIIDRNQEEDA
jgi:hypothetical protein